MDEVPKLKLSTGTAIPAIGFGTWQLAEGAETKESVAAALEIGYRLVDTAKLYGNERSVGEAIRESSLPRENIFVTTKLWNTDHGYDNALKAFSASLERLGLDYVDLYLIHWPASEKLHETWQALEEIYKEGKSRAIGVSNYSILNLQELLQRSNVVPAVNQLEFHPFVDPEQKSLVEFCQRHNIAVMAYSPLARGRRSDKLLAEIGRKYSKSASQVMLRWAIQHGTVPLPRSAQEAHIKENFEVFDFKLTDKDMAAINNLS